MQRLFSRVLCVIAAALAACALASGAAYADNPCYVEVGSTVSSATMGTTTSFSSHSSTAQKKNTLSIEAVNGVEPGFQVSGTTYCSSSTEENKLVVRLNSEVLTFWVGPAEEGILSFSVFAPTANLASGLYQLRVSCNDVRLFNDAWVQIEDGAASVVSYQSILNANKAAYDRMAAYDKAPSFSNVRLTEMALIMRSAAGAEADALSTSQAAYVKAQTTQILAAAKAETQYEKAQAIYEYVGKNLEYDSAHPSGTGAVTNPATNLSLLRAGKTAKTNCVGFACMVVAMARSQGIRARIVAGRYSDSGWQGVNDINKVSHHWAELYVGGRWIMADADPSSFADPFAGHANLVYFDCSLEQLSNNYLVKGVYKTEANRPTVANVNVTFSYHVSTGKPIIKWSACAEASSYKVLRCVKRYGAYTVIATTNKRSYLDMKTTAGKTYYYRVVAVSKVADKDNSEGVPATAKCKLKQPKKLTVKASGTKATIKWEKNGSVRFAVYRATSKTGKYTRLKVVKGAKYTDTKRKKGKKYYYKVRAVYKGMPAAKSAFSAVVRG